MGCAGSWPKPRAWLAIAWLAGWLHLAVALGVRTHPSHLVFVDSTPCENAVR